MHLVRFIPAALVMFFSGPSLAQGWMEYINREEFFSVNIPGEPVARDTTYVSVSGESLPARFFTVDRGPEHYSVTVVKYPDADDVDVPASIAHAAESFRQREGEVTLDERLSTDGIEGHMLQITNPDQSRIFVSMNLHKDRFYILEAEVPPGAIPPGLFQQSLTILDDMGRRIRYNTDIDGNKFRVIPGTGGQPLLQ